MCSSTRTTNVLKTNKCFIMNGKISLRKKTQLSDVIGELQRYIREIENKFRASELIWNANNSPNEETVSIG